MADKYATPTYTLDICVVEAFPRGSGKEGGLLHLANSGECSWQEYAQGGLDYDKTRKEFIEGAIGWRGLLMGRDENFIAKRPAEKRAV